MWGRLSNLEHVSSCCCIIVCNSSAAAEPINVSLQFTCCHLTHWVITKFQSPSYWPVMPRPSNAVWGVTFCGEFLYFKAIKKTHRSDRQVFPVGLVSYPTQSSSQLPMERQSLQKTNGDFQRQVPVTVCPVFPIKSAIAFHPNWVLETDRVEGGRARRRCDC